MSDPENKFSTDTKAAKLSVIFCSLLNSILKQDSSMGVGDAKAQQRFHDSNNCNCNDKISNALPTSRLTVHYIVHKCLFIGAQ